MGIFDKAKDALSAHPDQVSSALDKLADVADERTGNKHTEQIDKGVGAAKERLDDVLRRDHPPA
ncbi:antitoxin [uncultured Friedmanniella sp.]|uniref:antitoxin n=1 Tax=uncultured Friedmanniella sp. TaxID=335381 RepID=UPI0035CC0647